MTDTDLPSGLAKRPVDPKRGLPIPVMNMPPGSTDPAEVDFTGIHAQSVYDAAASRQCGICGEDLGYWIAFVGGPLSAQSRTYVDPGFHVECAEASLRLCPHMAIPRHKRAPEHRLAADSVTPTGFVEEKPEEIVIGVTRDYKVHLNPDGTGIYFKAAPFKTVRRFTYVNDVLTEISPS